MPSRPADPRERPIGVFDSGVGGLTVLHELLVRLPHEDYVYLADGARFPYGPRTREELEGFSLQIAEELLARGAKLLVVACNSATSAALPALRARMMQTTLGVDVLGVAEPAAVQAVAATRNGRVGLLATQATVDSGAYAASIAAIDPYVELTAIACPELAPHDRGGPDRRAHARPRSGLLRAAARGRGRHRDPRLHALPARAPDAAAAARPGGALVTSGAALARQVGHALGARDLASPRRGEGAYRFLCTGDADSFRAVGTRFLQMPIGVVEPVTLPVGEAVA